MIQIIMIHYIDNNIAAKRCHIHHYIGFRKISYSWTDFQIRSPKAIGNLRQSTHDWIV